ncbi:glycosyltransferase [Paenibacillus pabuli]|uniref:glycosyltransferase family protein n=1 Tax=Paenibacillus pabuli TaxID=1472 RepID=UPI003459FF67
MIILGESTIIIFKGQSQYDVLRHFADDLGDGFLQYGYNVEFIDLLNSDWDKKLTDVLNGQKNILFFLGMNGVGVDVKSGKTSLYDYLDIPFIAYFVDDPLHQYPRILPNVKNVIYAFIDKEHIEFVNQYMNVKNTKAFIPHGCKPMNINTPDMGERDIDVLVPGSFSHPEGIRSEWDKLGAIASGLLNNIAEEVYANRSKPLMDSAKYVLERNHIELDLSNNKLFNLLAKVDLYVRSRMRNELVSSLTDYNVLLCGNGWENGSFAENIKISKAIPFEEIPQLMSRSKIVLTVLPLFLYGAHERVFTAMSAGSVALVNKNNYFEEHFVNGKELVYFDSQNENLHSIVGDLLRNPEKMNAISTAGIQKAKLDHQWSNRAGEILKTYFIHKSVY